MVDTSHVNRMKHFPDVETRYITPPDTSIDTPANDTAESQDGPLCPLARAPIHDKGLKEPENIPQWKDIIEILDHRYRNQRIEFLIKQAGDLNSLSYWEKDTVLKDSPKVKEYLSNLHKPNTRSRAK